MWINFDLPNIPETYVNRIGRTGRAESSGIAISFCNAEEQAFLKDIQKMINKKIEVLKEHPFTVGSQDTAPKSRAKPPRRKKPASHKNVKEGIGNKNGKSYRSSSSKRRY